MIRKTILAACCAITAPVLFWGYDSAAQTADQGASAGPSGLEEIVVTAQRREERLQSVPIAVEAFDQTTLQRERIESIQDLQYLVPSLVTVGYGVTLRGQGNSNTGAGTVGSVITYFNEVPFANFVVGPGLYYDLQDLEVLKGPQGTLFGRNTNGGAILISSKKPTEDYEGYLQFTLGNYNDHELEGAVNIPVIPDRLLIRAAGQFAQRDGYTKVLSTGEDLDNRNYKAGRISVRLLPTDGLTNDVVYDYADSHTNGPGFILLGVNPANAIVAKLFPTFAQDLLLQQQLGPRYQIGLNANPYFSEERWGLTDTLSWDIQDNLTLKNIAAIRMNALAGLADQDGTPLPVFTSGIYGFSMLNNPHNVQYSEELQLQGRSIGDRLQWVLGGFGYYSHNADDEREYIGGYTYGNPKLTTALPVERSLAVFAQGTYDLSDLIDGLKLTGGYRETYDRRSNTLTNITNLNTGACAYGKIPDCTLSTGHNFSGASWTIGAEYQIDSDTMVYAKGSHGYKSGGINPQTTVPTFTYYNPEYVKNVELGIKSDWSMLGTKLRTNADIYHEDYSAIQIPTTVGSAAQGVFGQVVVNAGTATIQGLELDQTVVPFEGLEVKLGYAYLDAHYDNFTAPGLTLNNTPFEGIAHHTATLNVRYDLPVLPPDYGQLSFQGTYNWRSRSSLSTSLDPFMSQSDYGLLNLRLDWNDVAGYPADLSFFVTNATDTVAKIYLFAIYNAIGYTSASYNEPRMFGAQLKYRFGGSSAAPEVAHAAAFVPPPAVTPAPAPRNYMVFFDFNKSDLTPQAVQIVDTAAKNTGLAKVTQLTVTGHTDTVGSDAYNMRLSRRRAESVAAELEKDGIPPSEIEIVAKGKRDLLVPTEDGVREPQNRRVQIVCDNGVTS